MAQWKEYAAGTLCLCGHPKSSHEVNGGPAPNGCLDPFSGPKNSFCPCPEFAPTTHPVKVAIPNKNLKPISQWQFRQLHSDNPYLDKAYVVDFETTSLHPYISQRSGARKFMDTLGVTNLTVNGHDLETLLTEYGAAIRDETVKSLDETLQRRVAEELQKHSKKVPSTFKKNSRKFRPSES